MKEKLFYLAPECDEIALSLEGVIAQSVPGFNDGGDLDSLFS